MSLLPPKNCNESLRQYCSYGYDKTKYTSFEDCMKKGMENCNNTMNSQVIKHFLLKNDVINGVIPNSNGKPNVLFRKGDKVSGTIANKFIFNKQTKGILSFPTVKGAYIESDTTGKVDTRFFIPLDYLMEIQPNMINEEKNKEQEKDVWTGGVEWNKIFSVLNFWRLVIFCLFLYLFLKYLLPLIKQSLKKEG